MNKVLQQKVKDKCKDMGLSEEYVNGITEVLGADIADDSTDEAAIETAANRIADIAKRSQGEATRWAQKKQPVQPTPPTPPTPPASQVDVNAILEQVRQETDKRFKKLEEQNATLIAERDKAERSNAIGAAFNKHRIPDYLREYVTVPESVETAKIEEYVVGMAQKLVTQQLPGMSTDGPQVASQQETQAAADAFFKAHVKQEKQ